MGEITRFMVEAGGVATTAQILDVVSRGALRRAARDGVVVREERGRFALPQVEESRRAAHALGAVLSLRSAALHWGWPVRTVPGKPELIVARTRKITAERRRGVILSWREVPPSDVVNGFVTEPVRTVVDCARLLPAEESLAVADSALRAGSLTTGELVRAAEKLRGPGSPTARRVLESASGLAANPFESALRAITFDVSGATFRPQHEVELPCGWTVHPDLGDGALRLALEADSFEFHGRREGLRRDCWRYNELVAGGWTVLRFAWEHVMFEQEWVRRMVQGTVDRSDMQKSA